MGRDDLGAGVEVHLVAVVGRRVVGGGHHHPGRGVEAGDRPGEDRGRDHLIEEPHRYAEGGEHPRGVEDEEIRLPAGVAGDENPPLAHPRVGCEQVTGEAGCGLSNHETVHAHRTGADGGAEPRGTELEPTGEPLLEGGVTDIDQLGELGPDVIVGLGLEPAPRRVEDRG